MSALQLFKNVSVVFKVFLTVRTLIKQSRQVNRMGGTFSSAVRGSVTREQLLRSTTNSRDFTNKLFNVMLDKLTPADFLALGNPNKCSTFVFMMADGIQNLFRDLRIRPKRDRDSGVVFFQKVDTLKAQTAETRELCMTIAYFYIRIFQIFGALSMSILDDPGAGGVLGAVRYAPPQQQPGGIFGVGQPKRIPGSYPAVLRGGAVSAEYFRTGYGRTFAPIKQILEEDSYPVESGGEILQKFTFKGAPNITLIPGQRYNGTYENMIILLSKKIVDDPDAFQVHCDISLKRIDDTHHDVILRNFRVSFGSDTDELINNRLKGHLEQFQITVNPETKKVTVRGTGKSVPEQLNSIGKQIYGIYQRLRENPYASLEEIRAAEKQQRAKREAEKYGPGYKVVERDGQRRIILPAPGAGAGTVGIPKELQNQYMIDILKSMSGQSAPGQKTVAFCVARALQLLDANTIYSPKPQQGLSGVCMTKFESLPTSVPQTGQTIGTVPGIRAVDQLFYVNPAADHVRITDPAEYSDFLQQISGLFGRPTTAKLSKLDEIIARDPNCGASAAKQYLQLQNPRGIQSVLGIIGQMFARQLSHTQRVIQFFRQRLFTIVRGREGEIVNIHPRLLQGGIGELAAVSKQARELLVQYYKDCETLYQRGAEEVLRAKRV